MKRLLFIVFISVLSFNQTYAQESRDNLQAVSNVEQQTVVLFQTNGLDLDENVSSNLVLNKKTFKNRINLKLQGKIDLFRVKKSNKLC